MASSGARTRADLIVALRRRLTREDLDVSGPESFRGTVRVMRGQKIEPFPAAMFAAGWTAGAVTPEAMPSAPRDGSR